MIHFSTFCTKTYFPENQKKADQKQCENWRRESGSEFHETSPTCERGEWRKQLQDFFTQSLKQTPLGSCAISRLFWPDGKSSTFHRKSWCRIIGLFCKRALTSKSPTFDPKSPWIVSKELYIPSKKPCILSKEIVTRAVYLKSSSFHQKSRTLDQKSPVFFEKSHTFQQKSPLSI